jgi:alcohol dehydrogenase
MRGLTLDAVRTISYRDDIPAPTIVEPTDALVAVTAAGLCGSDLHPYEGREAARFGVVQGHEIVGHVLEVGPASSLRPGERVLAAFTTSCGQCRFCREGLSARCERGELFGFGAPDGDRRALGGGQAELVRVPLADSTAVAVPGALSDTEAVLLTDNLPTAWYAATRADVRRGDCVAVIGLGSVGLCAVVSAFAQGAGEVLAVDPVADRRARAQSLGATVESPDGVRDRLGTIAAVIEAAGTVAAQRLAFELLRPGGTLSVIAVQTDATFGFTPVDAYDRNVTVRAGRAPVRSVLDSLVPQIASGAVAVPSDVVVTHPGLPLEDGPEVYRRFAAREGGMVKAVFAP